jgi:IS30 family transposase
MDLLESMDARTLRQRVERRFKRLEPPLRKSITFDKGKENSEHKQLSENTGIAVYFSHPHSPREGGRRLTDLGERNPEERSGGM